MWASTMDPSFVEAARVFAQKILTQGPKDLDGRLAFAFKSATCRAPSAAELQSLRKSCRQQLDRFEAVVRRSDFTAEIFKQHREYGYRRWNRPNGTRWRRRLLQRRRRELPAFP
jgi:hypothetical protein